jgi:hypothetical protein
MKNVKCKMKNAKCKRPPFYILHFAFYIYNHCLIIRCVTFPLAVSITNW